MDALVDVTLNDAERDAVERFVDALDEQFGTALRSVWLFGSRARGESAHAESDIDLLVITDGGRARDLRVVSAIAYDSAVAAGVDPAFFSALVISPERLENRRAIRSFFIQEVDRDKIVLFGDA